MKILRKLAFWKRKRSLIEQVKRDMIMEISPNELMFYGNKEHYFNVGYSALKNVMFALRIAGRVNKEIINILDFACGHGRILRVLKAAFPKAKLTASDIIKDGVDFCVDTFGATGVYSSDEPSEIKIKGKFDLIWVSSLLTHLDSEHWDIFLDYLISLLAPKGILMFSVHGRYPAHLMATGKNDYGVPKATISGLLEGYERKKFGYMEYRKGDAYGISLSAPSFVISKLEKHQDIRILYYIERGLDNHQDMVAIMKKPSMRL